MRKNSFSKTLKWLEKAEKRNKKNALLFEIVFDLKNNKTILRLSDILNHQNMKEMDVQFNELDREDKGFIVPDPGKEAFYSTKNSPEILKIISEEMSKARAFKRERNKEIKIELMIFQRLSFVELKIIFYGHYYEEVRKNEIMEEFDINSFNLDD